MDTNISLIQGKKFKKYQKKNVKNIERSDNFYEIKNDYKKEGFTNIFEQNNMNVNNNNRQNTSDKMELDRLTGEFEKLSQQYTDLEKTTNADMYNLLERYSEKNPYNGKLLQINNGDVGYVTKRGDFKLFTSSDTIINTRGKNGCPSNLDTVDISNYQDSRTPGKVLNTTPSLLVGSYMISGQSCGNEGNNVYVDSLVPKNVKTTYKGCYADKGDSHTMTFLGTSPPLSTGALQNGNFNQPQIANNSYQYISSNDKVSGWNFYAVLINNSSAWGFPVPYPFGSQAACIQFSQDFRQWIQLTQGTYNVSFSACGRPMQGGANTINVYVVINTSYNTPQSSPVIYTFTPSTSKWQTYNTTFNVNESGLYGFGFYGTTSQDKSTAIQNIQITQSSENVSEGTYTYDMCRDDAMDNGYKYFALQNMNPSTGYGYCAVTNDEISATKYGKSIIATSTIPLWSSKTQGNIGCTAVLNNQGSLSVVNSSGASIFSTPVANKIT